MTAGPVRGGARRGAASGRGRGRERVSQKKANTPPAASPPDWADLVVAALAAARAALQAAAKEAAARAASSRAARALHGAQRPASVPARAPTAGGGAAVAQPAEAAAAAQPGDVTAAAAQPDDAAAPSVTTPATKKKGKGMVWNTPERVALCIAVRTATLNAVQGTSQTGDAFWEDVLEGFIAQTPKNLIHSQLRGRWPNRTVTAAKGEFLRNISTCCQRFAHFYHVASTRLTGNMDEAAVMRATRCLYSSTAVYAAVQKDVDYEAVLRAQGKEPVDNRARLVPENWQPCWQELRALDKHSGAAANPEMERLFLSEADVADGSDDSDSGSQSTAARSSLGKGQRPRAASDTLQRRPMGNKAAKKAAAADAASALVDRALQESLRESSKAMNSIADTTVAKAKLAEAAHNINSRREAIEFWSREENRSTPEGIKVRGKLLTTMAYLGGTAMEVAMAEAAARSGGGLGGRAAGAGPAAIGNGCGRALSGSDVLNSGTLLVPSTPPRRVDHERSAAADQSRRTNAMATKTRAAAAAIHQLSIDITTTPPSGPARQLRGASNPEDDEVEVEDNDDAFTDAEDNELGVDSDGKAEGPRDDGHPYHADTYLD